MAIECQNPDKRHTGSDNSNDKRTFWGKMWQQFHKRGDSFSIELQQTTKRYSMESDFNVTNSTNNLNSLGNGSGVGGARGGGFWSKQSSWPDSVESGQRKWYRKMSCLICTSCDTGNSYKTGDDVSETTMSTYQMASVVDTNNVRYRDDPLASNGNVNYELEHEERNNEEKIFVIAPGATTATKQSDTRSNTSDDIQHKSFIKRPSMHAHVHSRTMTINVMEVTRSRFQVKAKGKQSKQTANQTLPTDN